MKKQQILGYIGMALAANSQGSTMSIKPPLIDDMRLKEFTYSQSDYPTPYVRKKSKGNTKWKERINQFKKS